MQREYYKAYDDRYCQIHDSNLQWSSQKPSDILTHTLQDYSISFAHKILEIGCGEGRDAIPLLERGFDLLATDVSPEAIRYCQSKDFKFAKHFQVLDCLSEQLTTQFDLIYAISVIHMLVRDEDRVAFYQFIYEHLKKDGLALICTMGDGKHEHQSDVQNAFDIGERIHQETGKLVHVANTSCRMVSFQTFERELLNNSFAVIDKGITSVEPDFPMLMYAIVKKQAP